MRLQEDVSGTTARTEGDSKKAGQSTEMAFVCSTCPGFYLSFKNPCTALYHAALLKVKKNAYQKI